MKAKELMIGDWVMVYPWDESPWMPKQITAINYNSYRGSDYCDWVDVDGWDELSFNEIKPIPLTEEFFEKNGFKKETDIVGELWVSKDRRIIVRKDFSNMVGRDWSIHIDNEDMESIASGDIQYVHQFQNKLNDAEIEMEVIL